MIKVLARSTNTTEQFVDEGKEESLGAKTSQNFSLLCMRFLASTGPTSHFSSFFSMWYN